MARDYEAILQTVYEAVLEPGMIAADVGAHAARHAEPIARKVAPGGKVYAYEPLPACRKHIEYVLWKDPTLRDLIELFPYALADETKESEFVVAADALAYSGLRERVYDVPTKVERIPISVRRMDDLLKDVPRLDYVKIDAEGGELGVVRGATDLLARFRPFVTFEFGANSIGAYGITCADMGAFWLDRDYRLFDILGRPLATVEEFATSAERQEVWDYLAIPAENEALRAKAVGAAERGR